MQHLANLSPRGARTSVAVLLLLTALAYVPVVNCGFIWDDDDYVTQNTTLRDTHGLYRIWFDRSALWQYYPLVHTTFWIEYRIWELNPLGYHLVNVLLHGLNAVLWWLLLKRLRVPGAWLAAAIFAVHPVHVESVAWITERKNVLSGFFYLLGALAYLRFSPPRRGRAPTLKRWRWYLLASVFCIAALLSKTVACTLPAALVLVLWWRRGAFPWRDMLLLGPWLVAGICLGLITVEMEKSTVGAQGIFWDHSFADRCLIAGRVIWFYVGKLLWPAELIFFYRRWHIDDTLWWQYVFPGMFLLTLAACLFFRKRIGGGPSTAVLFFAGTLFPALGFFDVYPMVFSYVADHFQYMASMGVIALIAAPFAYLLRRHARISIAIACLVLSLLTIRTWRQVPVYESLLTLWTHTVEHNPQSWAACNNLGSLMNDAGKPHEAKKWFRRALVILPQHNKAHYNLAHTHTLLDEYENAIPFYKLAIKRRPWSAKAYFDLGVVLSRLDRAGEAVSHFEKVTELKPDYLDTWVRLGRIYQQQGRNGLAVDRYTRAVELSPDDASLRQTLALIQARSGDMRGAYEHLVIASELAPQRADIWANLGVLLLAVGRDAQAVDAMRHAVELEPQRITTKRKLAWILATHGNDAIRNGPDAVSLARDVVNAQSDSALALDVLAAAEAAVGRYEQAASTAKKAAGYAEAAGDQQLADQITQRMKHYQAGKPYRSSFSENASD